MKKTSYKSVTKLSNLIKDYKYVVNATLNLSNHHNMYSLLNGVQGLSTLTTSPSLEIVNTPSGNELWFSGKVGKETVLKEMIEQEGYLLDEGRATLSNNKVLIQLPLDSFVIYSNIDCLSDPDKQIILSVKYKDLELIVYLSKTLSLDVFLKLAKDNLAGKRKIESILFLIKNCLLGKLQKVSYRNKNIYLDYSIIGTEQDEQCWTNDMTIQTAYHTLKLFDENLITDIEIKPLVIQGMGYEVILYCKDNSIIKITY